MGIKINSQRNPPKEYIKALHFLTSLIMKRVLSTYKWNDFLYQFTSDYRKEQKCVKILDYLTLHQIAERKKYLAEKSKEEDYYFQKKSIFLDILLQSTVGGQPISDEEIKIQVNNFTFGVSNIIPILITYSSDGISYRLLFYLLLCKLLM